MVHFKRFLLVLSSLVFLAVATGCGQVADQQSSGSQADILHNTNAEQAQDPIFTESAGVVCTQEYMPVCGKRAVQCITAPCEMVEQTFSNRCMAEAEGATEIVDGACAMGDDDF